MSVRRLLKSLRLDQLLTDCKFPFWEHLHGLWRTLPNYNPVMVSADHAQGLENQAERQFSRSYRSADVSEGEVQDTSPLDTAEEDPGGLDIEDGSDNDAPDQVRGRSICVLLSSADDSNLARL